VKNLRLLLKAQAGITSELPRLDRNASSGAHLLSQHRVILNEVKNLRLPLKAQAGITSELP
jgi:hypothetical protein